VKSKNISASDAFSFLPSVDMTMYTDDGTAVQIRTRPAFVHMRFLFKGKIMSLAVLGHSTINRPHVLMNRSFAERMIEKLAEMKLPPLKSKTRPVVNLPVNLLAIVAAGLKAAIKNGTADIVFPAEMFDTFEGIGDASLVMMSVIAKEHTGGRDIRIQVDISDDVVLDVMPVSWPKPKPGSKKTSRPVSKTAN
jgi:hypothetical protein